MILTGTDTIADPVVQRTAKNAKPRRRVRRFAAIDCCIVLLLCAMIVSVWCAHYDRWNTSRFSVPVNYVGGRDRDIVFTGDGLWGMTFAKLMANGEIGFLHKSPKSLGAPFGANWNDWPSFEEGLNAWWGFLVARLGVFSGSNAAYLSSLLLAGAMMYAVCRQLQYDRAISFSVSLLFALSRYAFWRNLSNLTLTFYWHIPAGLLVAAWCIADDPITRDRRKLAVCGVVAILFGIQNPYYSGIFMQLLFWAGLYAVLRFGDYRRALLPAAIALLLLATIAVMNVDTFLAWRMGGPNLGVAVRAYFDVERYALKPIELVLPMSHSLHRLGRWAAKTYYDRTLVPTEHGSAFIGVIASLALVWLAWRIVQAVATGNVKKVPIHFWGVLVVAAFASFSGLNGIVGLFGFQLFRSSNRYSIVIMVISLLFLARELTAVTATRSRLWRALIAVLLVGVGIYDQVPPHDGQLESQIDKAWHEDEKLAAALTSKLPVGAMVFQLPVHAFPEGYLTANMDDYEPFRPFLHSAGLTFSYGDTKGRYQSRWQKEAEMLTTEGMVRQLERYGFSAVVINRDGYFDRGEDVAHHFQALRKPRITPRSDQWIAFELNPSRHPDLPPIFEDGWYDVEVSSNRRLRWSSGDATLVLLNNGAAIEERRLIFGLVSDSNRNVEISLRGQVVFGTALQAGLPHGFHEFTVSLAPGRNELSFHTDQPAIAGIGGDPRTLAFAITNLETGNYVQ